MNGTSILDLYRGELAERLRGTEIVPQRPQPLGISPWLAMSLLQKAIRRGNEPFALQAAATLLQSSPSRFWRRLCIIAYEDIGLADFDLVALVTAAVGSKRWRAAVGGEWAVASYLIRQLTFAVGCRAADDLAVVCGWDPELEQERLKLTFQPTSTLIQRTLEPGGLPGRALALWYAMGTDRYRSPQFRERKGSPQAVFDALCEAGYPDSLVEICREGYRRSGSILCPFVALLWHQAQGCSGRVEPDAVPGSEMIGHAPCWAYDTHVREGNRALAQFLEMKSETARWTKARVPRKERVAFLGGILFRVESGLMANRWRWPMSDDLKVRADLDCNGVGRDESRELSELLVRDLPILNDARRLIVTSNSR